MIRFLLLFALVCASPSIAAAPLSPEQIVGLKIKNRPSTDDNTSDSTGNWRSVEFETGGLSYRDFFRAMHDKGANAITLRIAGSLSEFATPVTYDQLYDEIAKVTAAAHAENMPLYLWERRWFTRDAGPKFVRDLKEIVARTDKAGTSAAIAGIILTEVRTTDGTTLRRGALDFARSVNRTPGLDGFLHDRLFVFPGGDYGGEFARIRDGLADDAAAQGFYRELEPEVGQFAWSFKYMGDWIKNPAFADGDVAAKRRWLNAPGGGGLDTLAGLVSAAKAAGHPELAHVIFWGDASDSIGMMPPDARAAVRGALVEDHGWTGYFFNLALFPEGDKRYRLWRKTSFVNTGGGAYSPDAIKPNDAPTHVGENGRPGREGYGNLWSDWANWAAPAGRRQVFCDIKRPLRRLTGQGPGEGFTPENYRIVLAALHEKLGCTGVRIEILTMVRKSAEYPPLYADVVAEARRLGMQVYSSPTEFGRLLPPDLREDEALYIEWVADHLNRFRPDYAGVFNEAGFNRAKMMRVVAGVRARLSPGYSPVFVGPDMAHVKGALAALDREPALASDFAVFGQHDIANDATPAQWAELARRVHSAGRLLWWTEISASGESIAERLPCGVDLSTVFWSFPRHVDATGALTERGRAVAAALGAWRSRRADAAAGACR